MGSQAQSNPHGPLDPWRLAAFEARIGATLPLEYRRFLVANNGGGLGPDEITLPGQTEPFTTLSNCTFGLNDSSSDLDRVYGNCSDVLPAELVAFAEDFGGNLFCIGIRGPCRGRVYFWDHSQSSPGDDTPGWDGLTVLAGSFDAFVAHLGRPQAGL